MDAVSGSIGRFDWIHSPNAAFAPDAMNQRAATLARWYSSRS
ncbi:hypothetical protein QC281_00350 [Streptomyces sp. DH17]|nr:hypothetical protein [Streptomyces sp. DH17]